MRQTCRALAWFFSASHCLFVFIVADDCSIGLLLADAIEVYHGEFLVFE